MNDWLTYLIVILLVFFVVSGVQLFLKAYLGEEVVFSIPPFINIKFRRRTNEMPLEEKTRSQKIIEIIINLIATLILSVIILASINSFFPRPAPANTNTPQPSLVPTATVAVATTTPQPTTRIAANTESPTATRLPATNTQIPIPTPTLGIGSTQISKIDGMVQVYVSAGAFTMGSDSGESDEKPIHTVVLDAFWIDKFEVTNAMYAMCVKTGKCPLPQSPKSYTRTAYFSNPQYDNYPVIYVTWGNANLYCSWAGRRLPTEAEWEKAARGTDGRIYPWGNKSPDKTLLNFNKDVGDTTEVGKYLSGASPYGALDMAGNVWEWVQSKYKSYPYNANDGREKLDGSDDRVLRGGSWNFNYSGGVLYRNWNDPTYIGSNIGFRCASSP